MANANGVTVRLILSFTAAIASFVASFFVFNFAFIRWAIWRYPQHNSMAGMEAFYYGLPVAAAFAVIGFVLVLRRTSRMNVN